ncbi:hypothetical protein A4A49_05366 [Nicotiana attenuata]|uniref:Carboxypeptidase A inhibitor-like domain-containing protein n=1 Tax=Nicotiana attenuata TaxID=49451 RepID=A0A1J6IRL9_NICAT|nr:hypothetical protein A4A49_05366 [Nicotiana attenuata]
MALLKLSFIITILIMTTIVNVPWFLTKQQVIATPDVDHVLSGLKRRVLPQLNTCLRPCTSDSDCSDCWTCCTCSHSIFDWERLYYFCA